MNDSQFDYLTRRLSEPINRRTAVGASIAAIALGALQQGVVGQGTPVPAVGATPGATDDKPVFLFVQTFASGRGEINPSAGAPTLEGTPTPGGGASLLLTMDGHSGQTIYFSDRPDQVVGAVPTQAFLDGLGFKATNPPNAALVAEFRAGQGVVVLQLIGPTYDAGSGSVTYGAEVLQGYAGESLSPVIADQVTARLPADFGPAALFIDDCANYTGCMMEAWAMIDGQPYFVGLETIGPIPGGPYTACFDTSTVSCIPCDTTQEELEASCNAAYPDICFGDCFPGN